MGTLTKNLQGNQEIANTPLKHQTHSTLFNQYNLPEYMLQQTGQKKSAKINGKASVQNGQRKNQNSSLRKDAQNNLDLLHIDKKVVSFKKAVNAGKKQKMNFKSKSPPESHYCYSFQDGMGIIGEDETVPQRPQMKTHYSSPTKTLDGSPTRQNGPDNNGF